MTEQRVLKLKRYHFYYDTKWKWVCVDNLGGVSGVGTTPIEAYRDCGFELELYTSDIHK